MHTLDAVLAVPFADLGAQYRTIKDEIDASVARVITESAFVGGPHVAEFERVFARYCGTKHCVGVANGTDAIFLALKVLGIGSGDEVITAANSFIATSEAITLTGARPVFVDIDPHTYTIDVDRIEERITDRTRAIVPVHLYGQPADMDAIRRLAHAYGLFVVGDAAQAHGAQYHGLPVSTLADITSYSFYPGKNLGAYGDAGALVTDNDDWAMRARMIANHGRTSKYDHDVEGINSRLDGLQAAVLSVKLRQLERWTERRRAIAADYNGALTGVDVVTPREMADVRAVYHLYVVRVPRGARAALQEFLAVRRIQTGVHYPIALPYLHAYAHLGHGEDDFPEARRASAEILSLPLFPEMTAEQVAYVTRTIASAPCFGRAAMAQPQHA